VDVVLVHGAWHGSWCWEKVADLLEERGIGVHTVDLPSVGADPDDAAGLAGDAAAVRDVLDSVDGPVLLVGHSYGGMVVTYAAAGRDDVARLLYLAAFMPDTGESLVQLTGGQPAPWIQRLDDGRILADMDQAAQLFYGECDPETREAAIGRLRPMTGKPMVDPIPDAAWRSIASTYVVCARDGALPPELQRDVFAPRADESIELDTDHSPFYSQSEALAGVIAERAAS
jgi:pimeloyl-ACP methyl ester carboxylesterase